MSVTGSVKGSVTGPVTGRRRRALLLGALVGIALVAVVDERDAVAGKKPRPASKARPKAKAKAGKGKPTPTAPTQPSPGDPTPATAPTPEAASPTPANGAAPTAPDPTAAPDPTPTATPPPPPPPTPSTSPPAPAFAPPTAANAAPPVHASASDDAESSLKRSKDDAAPSELALRLTLSTFLYRESGNDAPPYVDGGAAVQNASPVRRYFGDLRVELGGDGVTLDGRVRQTTSERYQSGASAGAEYELRTLSYKLGGASTALSVGRQIIDPVAATRIDGLALAQRLSSVWSATLFGGSYPQLGSRSVDTDYPTIKNVDGTTGAALIPLTGGLGVSWRTPDVHGDLGVAAIHALQTVNGSTASDASRLFVSSSGFWRPTRAVDLYHYGVLDLLGGVRLANGSVGVEAHPLPALQLTASVHHVDNALLQVAARNVLTDPDPGATGIIQNNLNVLHVASDAARAGASLALAHARFELSLSGGLHRRPAIAVPLADGTTVSFGEVKSADATFAILDRDGVGGLRTSLAGTLTMPIGSGVPDRSRGAIVRLTAGRTIANGRGEIIADLMGERFHDVGGTGACMTNADVFACYGTATITAGQLGAVASWRVAREWLLLVDAHAGLQDGTSTAISGPVTWPRVLSLTTFARVQWRYQ